MSSSLRKHPFCAKRPSGEERGETDVFTEASTKVGLDQLGPPVRVGSTRIDSDQLGSNKKTKKNKIGLGSTRIIKNKQLGL